MITKIEADLKTALLGGDKLTVSVLKMVKSALQNKSIEKHGELTDEEVQQVLRTELKKRQEAAKLYIDGGDQEAADRETKEGEIIAGYLPQQMSDEELKTLVEAAKQELGEGANPGQVISAVIARSEGRAEPRRIAALINKG